MVWRPCPHKTQADHARSVDGVRHWTCTGCGTVAQWGDGWGYYGSVECPECWTADIKFVWCSEPCRLALAAKHKVSPNMDDKPERAPRKKPRPAWERKAIAAGWTPPEDHDAEV